VGNFIKDEDSFIVLVNVLILAKSELNILVIPVKQVERWHARIIKAGFRKDLSPGIKERNFLRLLVKGISTGKVADLFQFKDMFIS